MPYSATKFKFYRSKGLSHRLSLALSDNAAPVQGAKMAAIADLAASPTNAQIATAFNTLLAELRSAGYLET